MPADLNLFIVAVFLGSVCAVVGLGLVLISVVLKAQARHRKRLGRVGRKRMSGRLDFDDARMLLLRHKQEKNLLVTLTDTLAKFVPLLDTQRLRANVRRAAMRLTVGGFLLVSVTLAGILVLAGAVLGGYPAPLLGLPSLLLSMWLVDRFVILRGEMICNRFMKQLPEALDTIIRGIRSGLPVIECIGTVGKEFKEPIGGHFQAISERVALGETLDAALWRLARVINRPEMDFLAVSISIQMETGGSLAEALGNLSDLLRKRTQMKLKIKAISSEAKASALIIGALPFVMLGLLASMSPDYVMPLFLDPRGQMMLGAGLLSISIGAFVMWRMTQFEI